MLGLIAGTPVVSSSVVVTTVPIFQVAVPVALSAGKAVKADSAAATPFMVAIPLKV